MLSDLLPRIAAGILPGVICRGDDSGVYLTFDDGPDPDSTPRFLEVLDQVQCRATFFLTASKIEQNSKVVEEIIRENHATALHGCNHESMLFASREKVIEDLRRSGEILSQVDSRRPTFFRPPYGRIGPGILSACRELELRIVLWSISARDWKPGLERSAQNRIVNRAWWGDIILLHDSGPGAESTLKNLPGIIHGLIDRGFSLKALDTGHHPLSGRE